MKVRKQISLLHFLYRCCYSLVLDVALYTVFRQSRPCTCSYNDEKVQVSKKGESPYMNDEGPKDRKRLWDAEW